MAEEVEDFLEHYGIKGMKWGVTRSDAQIDKAASRRASKKKESSSDNQPSRIEKRDTKRKAKSDKIKAKADETQAKIDDLEKNGVKSKYMTEKYGVGMGVDTRAADMKILLLHGHSKKSLLEAELNSLNNDKDHFLADADAAAKGKMTSKQKMLVGAAVTTVLLAGAIGAASYAGTKEIRRLDNIKPGQSIKFNDYWSKLQKTETSRLSGVSKDAFDKMSDAPMMVPSGTVFHRISTSDEPELRKRVFAAFKDDDVNRYKAALPTFWSSWGIGGETKGGYDVSIESIADLTSPSQKSRVKTFIDLLDKPIEGQDMLGNTTVKKGRDWLEESLASGGVGVTGKGSAAEDFGLKNYRNFALGLALDSPLNNAYFDKFKSEGFNALIDDNDSGKLSDAPMLIFDTSKTMKRLGATKLTPENIKEAQDRIVELTSRG